MKTKWYYITMIKNLETNEIYPCDIYTNKKNAINEADAYNEIHEKRAEEEGIKNTKWMYVDSAPIYSGKGTYTIIKELKEAREAK